MSQVIVTQDTLLDKRQRSREQERKIDRDGEFAKWKRSSVTSPDPFKKAVGFAVMPVLGLWAVLCGIVAGILGILRGLFRILGQTLGGRRNLITSEK